MVTFGSLSETSTEMRLWGHISKGRVEPALRLLQTLPPPPAHDLFERGLVAELLAGRPDKNIDRRRLLLQPITLDGVAQTESSG